MTAPHHDPNSNVVVVSLKDMYDTLVQLVSRVDLLIAQHTDQGKDLADHEARLRSLERGRWPLPTIGALAGVGALVVAILAMLGRH